MIIEKLIIAILCSAGFVCSWTMTNLKLHVLGVIPSLRNKNVDEIEDTIHLQWGRFGELLNCPYCLSSWLAALFFCFFSAIPVEWGYVFAAFFIAPALIHFLNLSLPRVDEVSETKSDDDDTTDTEDEYEFKAPFEIQKRILAIKDNPQEHQDLVKRNSFLLSLLHNPHSCPNDECRELSRLFKKETDAMERMHKKDPQKCPSCLRGQIVNKYFFQIYDLLGEQEVSLINPNLEKPKENAKSPFEPSPASKPTTSQS